MNPITSAINDAFKDRESRYQKLMNSVIKAGVKTKVLMLSATPVNNRFNDLRNQLALAYEGDPENLSAKLKTEKDINDIFRKAPAAFNTWSALPPEERSPAAILNALDFDFFELLDSVNIARSRKHIETFYDTSEIGTFPQRRQPLSFHCPLTQRSDVVGFNDIFNQLSLLKPGVYAPVGYILPSRLAKYEGPLRHGGERGGAKLKQRDRGRSLLALMTVNLLKRLESSVEAFRLTLGKLAYHHVATLSKIEGFNKSGRDTTFVDRSAVFEPAEPEDDEEFSELEDETDDQNTEREDEQGDDQIGGPARLGARPAGGSRHHQRAACRDAKDHAG